MRRLAMKKIYLTLVLVLSMSLGMFAQRSDGFFNTIDDDPYNRVEDPNSLLALPQNPIGSTSNEPAAPLGNGLLILTAVGLGYAIKKRKK